ncbi:hypothetical protein AB9F35_34175, partial [Rhizobium leguminosarum]
GQGHMFKGFLTLQPECEVCIGGSGGYSVSMKISLSCSANIDTINSCNDCMQYNYIIGKLTVNSPECRRAPQRMPAES